MEIKKNKKKLIMLLMVTGERVKRGRIHLLSSIQKNGMKETLNEVLLLCFQTDLLKIDYIFRILLNGATLFFADCF